MTPRPMVRGAHRGAIRADGTAPAVLAIDDVSFGYGSVPVVRGLTLHVDAGEFVAVVGANGSGKTTLMRLALGLLTPTSGSIRVLGRPIDDFDDWGAVGYVPQRAAASTVVPVSLEEVVCTGLAGELGLFRRPDRGQRQRIEHVLDLLDLQALRTQPVTRLSGGQQQRALLARALVTEPRLLVLDEPTTGVDARARDVLRATLEHLVRDEGVAVVYVSHDPAGFLGLADRAVEISHGRLHEVAQHDHPHLESEHPTLQVEP